MEPVILNAPPESRGEPGTRRLGLTGGASHQAQGPPLTGPLRILHLEDSPSDAELAREHLAAEGIACVVRRVETREEFSAAVHDGGIDLIVADYQLPDFDGLTAYAIAQQNCPDIPFLILTGKLGEEYAIDTLKLGVTDYILKQHLSSRLAPAVLRALDQQKERAARREAQEQLQRHQEHLEELVQRRTAELEERNGQLAVANRDMEGFLAAATHDLRTPLVIIGGFTRRLEKNCAGKIAAGDLDLLQRVIAAENRMERLIDDLLGFLRASKAVPQRGTIDMEAMIRETYAELLPVIGERQVRLEVSPLPAACGDPALIRQVLANLIANAIKYTGPRASAVIEVCGWAEPDATGYCIKDNGIGFDMRFHEKLFEIFQRLHDKDEFPGTGVGLAAVKRILEKHDGRIWATSVAGQSASFYFTLPRGNASSGPLSQPAAAPVGHRHPDASRVTQDDSCAPTSC